MEQKSIKKNFAYNFLLTIANMLFPLITAPYLSEILGASGIGRVNYATAIVSWFILVAVFGIPRFAVREIAKSRDDKEQMSSLFWNLMFIQGVLTIMLLGVYIVTIYSLPQFREELSLHLMMALMLLFNILNIDWFYQGIEEYGYIAVRNITVKCLSLLTIFLIINSPEDYLLLALINIFMVGINNVVNYIHSFKYISKKQGKLIPFYYLKQIRIFFYISIVVALYTQSDLVLLGMVDQTDLAFYVRSRTILNVGLALTTALITVISPRAAYLTKNDRDSYKALVQKSINYIYLLGIPISVGILLFAEQAMYVLGGSEFAEASLSLQIMAPLSLIITLGSWVSSQILIPNGLEKISFRIQCVAVVISLSLNFILIPRFSFIGATITWLAVETFLFIMKAIYAKLKCPDIKITYVSSSLIKFLISTLLMILPLLMVEKFIDAEWLQLVFAGIVGVGVYFSALIILREKHMIFMLNEVRSKFS